MEDLLPTVCIGIRSCIEGFTERSHFPSHFSLFRPILHILHVDAAIEQASRLLQRTFGRFGPILEHFQRNLVLLRDCGSMSESHRTDFRPIHCDCTSQETQEGGESCLAFSASIQCQIVYHSTLYYYLTLYGRYRGSPYTIPSTFPSFPRSGSPNAYES